MAVLGLDWGDVARARAVDLAQPWERGMPVSPNHPPFQLAMMRRHGDMVRSDGGSAANELIVMGGHVGTHIDALGHVSHAGKLYGGLDAAASQSHAGLTALGIDEVPPILCRGVLLDVASVHGVDALEPGYEVTPADLDSAVDAGSVDIREGDAILIRTGWARHWSEPDVFRGLVAGAPGPGEDAARWLVQRRPRLAGAETIAFEVIRPSAGHTTLPVHRVMLVEAGVNLIEVMNLTELAATGAGEFLFSANPLRIVGGTGSPIRPVAFIDG